MTAAAQLDNDSTQLDNDSTLSPASNLQGGSRKRSSRACDGCKARRSKCEDIQETQDGGQSCRLCRESQQQCLFNLPVRKRGPAPGFRAHVAEMPSTAHTVPSHTGRQTPGGGSSSQQSRTPSPVGSKTRTPARGGEPFFGIPTAMVDQLLAVYFTHVHNVWPLIHKPFFNPHKAPSHLLLSMLAVASCVAPSVSRDGLDAASLFAMAERALHHRRMESRVDIIQSLILLSLRQTGCGDKRSAALYAGRACMMVLTMGLNLAPGFQVGETSRSDADSETRARVYWNCYVLDKTIAEETGRPFLLPYRRASIPFPSVHETDELETWPPLPMSSSPLPHSVRHIVPRRGYVLSCFVWTCRLAMVVEDILDLEVEGPASTDGEGSGWDREFGRWTRERREKAIDIEGISRMLDSWKSQLPASLDVEIEGKLSPLPHHVVSIAWYHTARILLYSRSLRRHSAAMSPMTHPQPLDPSSISHGVCSEAAQAVVDLLGHLDRFRLLQHVSSDIIHLLSLATLFEAYDSMSSDSGLANRAKLNFSRCCLWLREFSSSWPAASAHKVFFEGLIRGGLQLSSPEDDARGDPQPISVPTPTAVINPLSPPIPDGLRAVRRHLSVSDSAPQPSNFSLLQSDWGLSNLFQLPQFYWNQLSNPPMDLEAPDPYAPGNFAFQASDSPEAMFALSKDTANSDVFRSTMSSSTAAPTDASLSATLAPEMTLWEQSMGEIPSGNLLSSFSGGASSVQGPPMDQGAIYEALMSYMLDAARGR